MLSRVYSVFDKKRRPLRNHVYLAFPEHNFAYARATEPAFRLLAPFLNYLAGNVVSEVITENDLSLSSQLERQLFHGNVELLTARELKRRYPDMKIFAWVQDPIERLAYCYEKVILADEPLPSYYSERFFDKGMSVKEFVEHVSTISDLEADNLFRSQTATLSYKGMLTADIVLPLEHFEQSFGLFMSEFSLKHRPRWTTKYRVSDYISSSTLRAFSDAALSLKLQRRYRSDYASLFSNAAVLT